MRAIICLLVPILTLITSCASFHVPASNHVPLMEGKGDGHINGSFGVNGFGIQTGYAITDYLGLVGSTNFGKVAIEADNSRDFSSFEGGLNYFTDVGSNGKLEFLGTVGIGSSELLGSYSKREASGTYMKYSLQNNAAYSLNNVDGGLSTRVSYINYYKYEDTAANEEDKTAAFFFEPAFFTGLNYKNISLESQFGYSIPLIDHNNLAFDVDLIRVSVAVKFRFNSL